ncbi:MAG TPA: hypothetical protein VFZ61_25425 [Polyangiales bacterium]
MSLHSWRRSALIAALTFSSLSLAACADEKKPDDASEDPSTADDDASSDEEGRDGGGHADAAHDGGTATDGGTETRAMDATTTDPNPGQKSNVDAAPPTHAVDAAAPQPSTCGGPGQACCPGDSCSSGCCVNDICLANGTSCGMGFGSCTDNACTNCGKAGQGCCPGRTCQSGSACGAANTCVACGGADERCCADRVCSAGACVGAEPGVCKAGCGARDQMCCVPEAGGFTGGGGILGGVLPNVPTNSGMCVAELSCLRGKCTPCGAENEACCPGSNSCDGDLQCIDSKCAKCGQPGQACCAPTATNLDGCFGPLNVCQNGACSGMTCGLLNEACCPTVPGTGGAGACSATGTYCISGACKSCGGLNEPCCPAGLGSTACAVRGSMCMAGTCKMP